MENFDKISEPSDKWVKKEKIPIPFIEGYEICITGGEIYNEEGKQIVEFHIWNAEDESEKSWSTLTGVGFIKMMNFIEEELGKRNIKEFTLSASDDKRERVFSKWAIRRGCNVRELPDWDGIMTKVYSR